MIDCSTRFICWKEKEMRKTLTDAGKHRRVCDTEKAEEIGHETFGKYGDPAGYEEIVYKTKGGVEFIYGVGGPESPYPEPELKLVG
jgi:hypothetical protein